MHDDDTKTKSPEINKSFARLMESVLLDSIYGSNLMESRILGYTSLKPIYNSMWVIIF